MKDTLINPEKYHKPLYSQAYIDEYHDSILETQALALEGNVVKVGEEKYCENCGEHTASGYCQCETANKTWQQAADHLRAQKIALQDNK